MNRSEILAELRSMPAEFGDVDYLFDFLTARGDELFELVDALLCADGPVRAPVDLTPVAEHHRGHGAMYDALNSGNIDVPRLRQVLAGLPVRRHAGAAGPGCGGGAVRRG